MKKIPEPKEWQIALLFAAVSARSALWFILLVGIARALFPD